MAAGSATKLLTGFLCSPIITAGVNGGWTFFRSYVPAPPNEDPALPRYGTPPFADSLSSGTPVTCTFPVASIFCRTTLAGNKPSTLEGVCVAVCLGEIYNPTTSKPEQLRFVFVLLGGKEYVVPLENVAVRSGTARVEAVVDFDVVKLCQTLTQQRNPRAIYSCLTM